MDTWTAARRLAWCLRISRMPIAQRTGLTARIADCLRTRWGRGRLLRDEWIRDLISDCRRVDAIEREIAQARQVMRYVEALKLAARRIMAERN